MSGTKSKEMDLTVGSPFWSLLKFAIPVILGNLFQLFYTLADSVIVGKTLGAAQTHLLQSVPPALSFILSFVLSMVLQVVSASVSASAVAQKMKKECEKALPLPRCSASFLQLC